MSVTNRVRKINSISSLSQRSFASTDHDTADVTTSFSHSNYHTSTVLVISSPMNENSSEEIKRFIFSSVVSTTKKSADMFFLSKLQIKNLVF